MVSLNKSAGGINLTTNYEGGEAYKIVNPKEKLYNLACTRLFGENKFYEKSNQTDDEILRLIDNIILSGDPKFPLQLAAYIREQLYLRTTPLVILGYCSIQKPCQQYIKEYVPKIVKRADEMAEIIAIVKYFIGDIGDRKPTGSLPAALKKALRQHFWKFNTYQLRKYLGTEKSVKLSDVIKLVHPKPNDEEKSKFLKDILENKVSTPSETWENFISVNGSTKENWEKIIPEMPIMATIRNLRNFLEKEVSQGVLEEHVISKLTNKETILNSKQLPFRFWSAYNEVSKVNSPHTREIMEALQTSMDISVENLPKLSGKTAIGVDHSGSMSGNTISSYSSIDARDIGDVLVGIADGICDNSIPFVFADDCKIVNKLTKRAGVLFNKEVVGQVNAGGGTTSPIFPLFTQNNINVDRFIIFSDEQTYENQSFYRSTNDTPRSALAKYRQAVNPNVKVYFVNLVGYGTSALPLDNPKNVQINGWSENIFRFISQYEQDAVRVIKNIETGW